MLLCTMPEEPKHPHIPTFDHVSADRIKICLIRLKYPEILELSRIPDRFKSLVSPFRAGAPCTWSISPKFLASSAVI